MSGVQSNLLRFGAAAPTRSASESERLASLVGRAERDARQAREQDMPMSAALLDTIAEVLDERRASAADEEAAAQQARRLRRQRLEPLWFWGRMAIGAAIVVLLIYSVGTFASTLDRWSNEEAARVVEQQYQQRRQDAPLPAGARVIQCPIGTVVTEVNYEPGRTRCLDGSGNLIATR